MLEDAAAEILEGRRLRARLEVCCPIRYGPSPETRREPATCDAHLLTLLRRDESVNEPPFEWPFGLDDAGPETVRCPCPPPASGERAGAGVHTF